LRFINKGKNMFDAEYMDGSATIISCGDDYLKMEVVK